MIGKICCQQIVKVFSIFDLSWRSMSSSEPSFPRSVVSSIELQRKKILQSLIHPFPFNEVFPADNHVRVGWIESRCFELPTICAADVVREDDDLSLNVIVEQHAFLLRVPVVLISNVGIGRLIPVTFLRVTALVIRIPRAICVNGKVIDGHDAGSLIAAARVHELAFVATTGITFPRLQVAFARASV
jgi:hypothetical protein